MFQWIVIVMSEPAAASLTLGNVSLLAVPVRILFNILPFFLLLLKVGPYATAPLKPF